LADDCTIINCLSKKLAGFPWQQPLSRQRQQYWLNGYKLQSHYDGLPEKSVEDLLATGIIIASHSLKNRAIPPFPHPAYLRLASTELALALDTG